VAAWCAGDFDATGFVDGSDFLIWNGLKFNTSAAAPAAIPEPGSWLLLWTAVAAMWSVKKGSGTVVIE